MKFLDFLQYMSNKVIIKKYIYNVKSDIRVSAGKSEVLNLGLHAQKQWVMRQDNNIHHGIYQSQRIIRSCAHSHDLEYILTKNPLELCTQF